ncbi:alpha-hydroxy acid oxidase [Streptomyces sp. SL13]|uniref:Alpha-hydroxy acid oxidase n=1 Tax=Streptantibioticus silvisoli TaxID=2705255 RepID=A0AA90H0H9_9ACTN|nr:alpha-hydroxy acid oxidase [Streptantibioticus silvisoli]MDI5961232.1 alpha-hydroxy acid oxidase [Streptantibioticus silvisoli]MDI5971034.1 alpha-hydroxy acid oxidase [Streptantibioticus silvisoli]
MTTGDGTRPRPAPDGVTPADRGEPLDLADLEAAARDRLPADVWDFIEGAAGEEWTLAANRAQFQRLALRPRVLVDVSAVDPGVELLGARLAAPIGVAPLAYHGLAHPEAELATARAAGAAGALFVVGMLAGETIEDIAAAATGPLWLQLYWLRRRDVLADVVRRAADAGYRALVLTVDAPRVGRRLRDVRNSFRLPDRLAAVNIASVPSANSYGTRGASAIEAQSRDQFDPAITWADLAWLRALTPLPLVLKGVLTAEDARLALDHGVDAVIVSNHGGRQLDGAVPPLAALPEVAGAVGERIPVLLDGGIRSGGDIAKALALGARTVLVGRPVLWGLAHDGRDGVAAVLRLLREDLEQTMTLAGRPRLTDLTPDTVTVWPPAPGA